MIFGWGVHEESHNDSIQHLIEKVEGFLQTKTNLFMLNLFICLPIFFGEIASLVAITYVLDKCPQPN